MAAWLTTLPWPLQFKNGVSTKKVRSLKISVKKMATGCKEKLVVPAQVSYICFSFFQVLDIVKKSS